MGIDRVGSPSFRQLEAVQLQDGKIDAGEAAALGKAAASDPQLAKQVLEQDNFENPKARAAYVNAAHLKPTDGPGNSVVGKLVGGAAIVRTLGDPKGYANAMEAVAAARMSGVENAGVVKQGGRYIPVQLSKSAPGQQTTEASLAPAIGLLPRDPQAIDKARADLKAARDNHADGATLQQLQKELASKTFGLPPSSFNIIGRERDRVATTVGADGIPQGINIQNGLFDQSHGDVGTHGSVGTPGTAFSPKNPTAITIDAGDLEGRTRVRDSMVNGKPKHETTFEPPDTDQAIGVLEHEATHLEDTEEAKALIKKWGGDFDANPAGFQKWLGDQAKNKTITYAQMSRVSRTVTQFGGDTELHAHLATAVDAIRNGAPAVAVEQLKDYAVSVKRGSASIQETSHVLAEVARAYQTMTKDQQKQLQTALDAAGGIFKGFNPAKFDFRQDI